MKKHISSARVERYIIAYIADNTLKCEDRLQSIRVIAESTGASISTVQKATANLARKNIIETRLGAGLFVAKENNDQANLIGILSPHFDSLSGNFMTDAIFSIKTTLQLNGYCPITLEPPSGIWGSERDSLEKDLVKRFLSFNVKGLIVASSAAENSKFWSFLKRLNTPLVCFNNSDGSDQLNLVTSDNHTAGIIAAKHFIERGHTSLAVVTDVFAKSLSEKERVAGFKEELSRHNLSCETCSNISRSSDDQTFKNTIKCLKNVTGVFAINDSTAIQLMTHIQNESKTDMTLSFLGFDDSILCDHVKPRLTSINQFPKIAGERTAKLLLRILADGCDLEKTQIRLKPELHIRDSVSNIS